MHHYRACAYTHTHTRKRRRLCYLYAFRKDPKLTTKKLYRFDSELEFIFFELYPGEHHKEKTFASKWNAEEYRNIEVFERTIFSWLFPTHRKRKAMTGCIFLVCFLCTSVAMLDVSYIIGTQMRRFLITHALHREMCEHEQNADDTIRWANGKLSIYEIFDSDTFT